jgi:thiamine-phosphate pyrophosphorylase
MQHQFTIGAQRAIEEAAEWSDRVDSSEVEGPALLLGLLAQGECRAAILLAEHGVDADAVRRRWPALNRREASAGEGRSPPSEWVDGEPAPAVRWSSDVEASLAAISVRMHEYARPLVLATEHLLLGLAATEHEVSIWLRRQGIDPDRLEREIHRRHGHQSGPLPLVDDETAESPRQSPAGIAASDGFSPGNPPSASSDRVPSRDSNALPARERAPLAGVALHGHVGLLRVVDAAANRGGEGLRAVEDYVRFVLDDRHLTGHMKRLRHDLTALLSRVPIGRRLAARETQADVGTRLTTRSERRREAAADVVAANFIRLQQSLRTLEEFGKLLDAGWAARFEQLRYRTYTLQRAVEVTRDGLHRLAEARLYVLIDGRSSEDAFVELARSLVEAGVHVLQLRDKGLDDRPLLQRGRLLREITSSAGTLFVMNDRPDLAVLAGADGVHVGQEELRVKDARTIAGSDLLVGVSTHSIEQARQAVLDGANYIGVGPTFPSGTKHFEEFPGVDLLRAVACEIRLPAFAVGGITRENLPDVFAAGLGRVAVGGAVTGAGDPVAAAQELLTQLERFDDAVY